MSERLEADTALLNVVGGRPMVDDPPGMAAFSPPRKAARGRERDLLFLCLGLRARAAVPAERYTELLGLAAATFYGQPGSVTAAGRYALAAVNRSLLDANLREAPPCSGGLICAVLRGADFYAVQSGPGAVIVGHDNAVERFPNLPSRPLGLSDALDAQYFHTVVSAGEYVTLSPNAGWNDTVLTGLGGLSTLSAVAERLKSAGGADFTALVARIEPEGTLGAAPQSAPGLTAAGPTARRASSREAITLPGALTDRLRGLRRSQRAVTPEDGLPADLSSFAPPSAASETLGASPDELVAAEPGPPAEPANSEKPRVTATDWQQLMRRAERLGGDHPSETAPASQAETLTPPRPALKRDAQEAPAGEEAQPIEPEARDEPPPIRRNVDASVKAQASLRAFGRAISVTITEAVRSARQLLARSLPEGTLQRDGLFSVPTPVQIGIAVLTPLIVVGLAFMIYLQYGQGEQFTSAVQEAQTALEAGRGIADQTAARPYWEAAIKWIDQAERVRPGNPELAPLRLEAQGRLDALDGITRLNFQPLIASGLGQTVQLTQVVLVGRDVYALDSNGKRVLRLMQSNTGEYVADPTFQCASGPVGPISIGPLIDIGFILGPNVRESDSIVALDSAGGLIYCAPNEQPIGGYLTAPDTGWIQPIAMEIYDDRLYIFDPGQNQVWQYQSSGGAFNQPPTSYFTQVVYDLKDSVDFTIAGGDLMILRKTGQVTVCSRTQAVGDASCAPAAPFSDTRPGRVPTPLDHLEEVTAPKRLVYDQPPEPSVLLLDGNSSALYQLSLKLNLVQQFRPAAALPAPITSAAIDPSKRLFVTAGDNVYVAARP